MNRSEIPAHTCQNAYYQSHWSGGRQRGTWCTAGGNANLCSHYGDQHGFPAWPQEEEPLPPECCCFSRLENTRQLPGTDHDCSILRTSTIPHRECLEISAALPPILAGCARLNNRALRLLKDFIGVCL